MSFKVISLNDNCCWYSAFIFLKELRILVPLTHRPIVRIKKQPTSTCNLVKWPSLASQQLCYSRCNSPVLAQWKIACDQSQGFTSLTVFANQFWLLLFRAAAIHQCTLIFFATIWISIFEWDIAVLQNNKIFLIKNQKLLYQHSEITVLISLMTSHPSSSLF